MQNSWSTDGNFSLFLTTDSNSLNVTDYVLWPFIKYSFSLPMLSGSGSLETAQYKEDLISSQTQFRVQPSSDHDGWRYWMGLRMRIPEFCSHRSDCQDHWWLGASEGVRWGRSLRGSGEPSYLIHVSWAGGSLFPPSPRCHPHILPSLHPLFWNDCVVST